jgi:hypothetical protein
VLKRGGDHVVPAPLSDLTNQEIESSLSKEKQCTSK